MVLDSIFERFAEQSPVTVMARAALEHALDPGAIDALFENVAERQYTRTLLFSTVVDLMATVVCNVRPAIHAAFQANAESIGVSLRAVYDKIDRTEPGLSAGLGRPPARPTWPGPSTGSRNFGPSGPGHCPATPWWCSTRRRCWSPTCSCARTVTPRSG